MPLDMSHKQHNLYDTFIDFPVFISIKLSFTSKKNTRHVKRDWVLSFYTQSILVEFQFLIQITNWKVGN